MKKQVFIGIIAALLTILVFTNSFAKEKKATLEEIRLKIQKRFDSMDKSLQAASGKIQAAKIDRKTIRKAIRDLYKANPDSIDCALVDIEGIMQIIEPEEYHKFQGANISSQSQVRILHKTKKPVMSNIFLSVEKVWSIDVEYPVFNKNGILAGSVSVLFSPAGVMGKILSPYIKKTPYKFSILETDGECIYDTNVKLIGKNMLKDPKIRKSPGMKKAVDSILRKTKGSGAYKIKLPGSKEEVNEEVTWTTVDLYGTKWRVVLIEREHE